MTASLHAVPGSGSSGSIAAMQVPARRRHVVSFGGIDIALVCLFMFGIYTNYTIQISTKVPFPSVPAGVAGLLLLWRWRDRVTTAAFVGFIGVLLLYVLSILCATDVGFLPRRTNGLIQLTYSLTVGYGLFIAVTQASRRQIANLFLTFSLVILIGCLLESYGGLRPVSDAVRRVLYSSGIYENDLRDVLFYHRVRPKFFASEPAGVTFCYALFTFIWMVVSTWRWKLPIYVVLFGLGTFAMPGPTLMLMLLLILPYMLFLGSRRNGRLDYVRALQVFCLAALLLGAFVVLGQSLFAARLKEVTSGNDPSFFYRVQGPFLAALDVARNYPLAGTGLTGEPFIEREVVNIYIKSPDYSARWEVVTPATELLINYFWLHWIYLGIVWGAIVTTAITLWLLVLGTPSPGFCWIAWAILGQASGAYVGPKCWAVMFLAAAAAVLQQRIAEPVANRRTRDANSAGRYLVPQQRA